MTGFLPRAVPRSGGPRLGQSVAERGEQGGALVETAVVLPVFLMLVLALFTGGLLYNQRLDLTDAAREGARFGATVPQSQTFAGGTWATNVRQVVVERSGEGLDPAHVCVALVSGSPGAVVGGTSQADFTTQSPPRPCYDDGNRDPGPRVQVSVRRPGEIQGVSFRMGVTMTVRATAKHEG